MLTGDQLGRHTVVVSATDGVTHAQQTTYFAVGDANDVTPPVVSLASPLNLAEITAPTDIIGTAQDDSLVNVLLAYKRADAPLSHALDLSTYTPLYEGPDTFVNQTLATFDTTLLVNGLYHLVLHATDANGLSSTSAITVEVSGDLKVGHFSFTLQDLSIPLAGIPITISRT